MEKLIEILNEYEEEKGSEIRFKRIDNSDFFVCGDDVGLGYETILSKNFGFIKWLVDNDKIDVDEINCQKIPYYSYIDEKGYVSFKRFGFYEQLLMLLSISDTPIEDLISYLK